MEIDVTFTPAGLKASRPSGRTVVVIDVVRACSTMVQGLANGCTGFLPVRTVTEARRRALALSGSAPLLGGERRGVRLPGFQLGNSPLEYTAEMVAGRSVVFSTTNGTAAIKAAGGGSTVVIGSFLNLGAVAEHAVRLGVDVTLAGAGAGGRPVLDDAVCAGMLAQRMQELTGGSAVLTDAAQLALHAAQPYHGQLLTLLRDSFSGRALLEIGYGQDLEFCARLDALPIVP
ncbi:MAG: 2-phosphosulfolactate phosphatase, partial [Chloroflexota bacterium]